MPTVATTADVSARLGRPLNPGEVSQIEAYLTDAESKIVNWLPDKLNQVTTDPVAKAVLVAVEVSAALRAAKLTDGIRREVPGFEELNQTTPSASRANVTILNSEWDQLGLPWAQVVRINRYDPENMPGYCIDPWYLGEWF